LQIIFDPLTQSTALAEIRGKELRLAKVSTTGIQMSSVVVDKGEGKTMAMD
jgi:hypothetical protein